MNILETLKTHKNEIKQRFRIKKIGIFGSYARNEQTASSDIDILVDFEDPNFDTFIDLLSYCEELFDKSVDLITATGLSPHIKPYMEKEIIWV